MKQTWWTLWMNSRLRRRVSRIYPTVCRVIGHRKYGYVIEAHGGTYLDWGCQRCGRFPL